MAMKPETVTVFKFLQANADKNLTVEDVAAATGIDKKKVGPAFTMAIQRKGWGQRVEAKDPEGNVVKLLKLTDAGKAVDVDALAAPKDAE